MTDKVKALFGTSAMLLVLTACEEMPAPFALQTGDPMAAGVTSLVLPPPQILDDLDTDLVVSGAKVVANGVGLDGLGAGSIEVTVPAGATVQGAFLYWGARGDGVDPSVMTVTVDGSTTAVVGDYIGSTVVAIGNDSHSFRSDLVAEGFSFGPGLNTADLVLDAGQGVQGASLVILYDDGTVGSVELRDGNDFAFEPIPMQTNEQTFTFPGAPTDRQATLLLVVGDVEDARPTMIKVVSGGSGDQQLDNVLGDGGAGRNGDEWDTYAIDVTVPAGETEVKAQLFSWDDPSQQLPASLYWVVGALEIPDPPRGGGQGCTPGYWKQPHHFDSWTVPLTPETMFSDVFENAFPGMTLLQVLSQGGGHLKALGRHTVAALLNAASGDVSYDLAVAEVVDAFNAVYPGPRSTYGPLKDRFAGFNEQGCPLN